MTRGSLAILLLVTACGGKIEPEAGTSSPHVTGGKSTGVSPGSGKTTGVSPESTPQVELPATCKSQPNPPIDLECTGLYADIKSAEKPLAAGVREYTPAVILWSDGAEKNRYIQLPKGEKIDATDPSSWIFPIGTKVWKQFALGTKRMETRYFVKLSAGSQGWSHATYMWNQDDTAATKFGGGDVTSPDGGVYHIPIFGECEQCHQGRQDRILGFEQIGLGLDQPGVALGQAQGITLADLVSENLIDPPPAQTSLTIGDDGTGKAANALAWLHMNCGVTCHNSVSSSTAYGAGMLLRMDPTLLDGRPVNDFDPLKTTIGVKVHTAPWEGIRIVAGDPDGSLLWHLISTRSDAADPSMAQMPPIASRVVDTMDVQYVYDWIAAMPKAATADGGGGG
jgi:hypothetical protein